MKRIIILCLCVVLMMGLLSCSDNIPSAGIESKEEFESNISTEACQIEYLFRSARDLHTYVTMGSKNIEDYTSPPLTPLEDMPASTVIKAYGYHSIYEYFNFNEKDFDSVEASFMFTDDGDIVYRYYLDNVLVIIQPTVSDDVLECYAQRKGVGMKDGDVTSFSTSSDLTSGLVLRERPDCDIMYRVENGIRKQAFFAIGGSYITISSIVYSDDSSATSDFLDFVTATKTSAFSAFFSDDDSVVKNAIANIKEVDK